ncbi:hypothetical protein ACFFIX_01430 [Metabacillus herbersteinensis]|uniref:RNA polymerase subunit sigma-70 n=1 Tax=Metabacillus herbersteinensis TaxID=283816 RepID=A0ABV6G8Z1_9BACI
MRHSQKGELSHSNNEKFGVDFHDCIANEQQTTSFELASEFGLSLREVKNFKKQLNRS